MLLNSLLCQFDVNASKQTYRIINIIPTFPDDILFSTEVPPLFAMCEDDEEVLERLCFLCPPPCKNMYIQTYAHRGDVFYPFVNLFIYNVSMTITGISFELLNTNMEWK